MDSEVLCKKISDFFTEESQRQEEEVLPALGVERWNRKKSTSHGGETYAEGIPKIGATFYFTLGEI